MRGIKAISIDPTTKAIAQIEISPETRLLRGLFGTSPTTALRLTKGDVLLTARREYGDAFIVGGSRPIVGPGLIVGRRSEWSDRASARIALDDVVTMVRWASVERPAQPVLPPPPASMRAIVIDPKLGLIEERMIAPHMPAAEQLLGGMHDWKIRLPSGDFLLSAKTDRNYGWWVRLYGEMNLIGRCVIVGHDEKTGYLADVTVRLEQLRNWVDFRGPDDKCWARYSDRRAMAASTPAE